MNPPSASGMTICEASAQSWAASSVLWLTPLSSLTIEVSSGSFHLQTLASVVPVHAFSLAVPMALLG